MISRPILGPNPVGASSSLERKKPEHEADTHSRLTQKLRVLERNLLFHLTSSWRGAEAEAQLCQYRQPVTREQQVLGHLCRI
jgi:hypothetical protein